MLLFWVLIICLYQLSIDLVTIVNISINEEKLKLIADFYNCPQSKIVVMSYIFLIFCTGTHCIFVILVLQLIFLHKWLAQHDITTYEYICFLRKKEENPDLELNFDEIRQKHESKVLQRIKNDNISSENVSLGHSQKENISGRNSKLEERKFDTEIQKSPETEIHISNEENKKQQKSAGFFNSLYFSFNFLKL